MATSLLGQQRLAMFWRSGSLRCALIGACVVWSIAANAQTKPGLAPAKPPPQKLELAAPSRPLPAMPSPEDMLGLIRSTLIALNQANQTGNYTVLRDLAAPDFRNANDASRLGAIFQVLRTQSVDLTPLLRISPEVSKAPAIDQRGLLGLVGYFPTQPLRVNFDLAFELSGDVWRAYSLSVFLAPPPAPAAVSAPPAPVAVLEKAKK